MNNLRLKTLKVSDKSQCLLCGGSSFKQRARDHNHNLKNEKKKKIRTCKMMVFQGKLARAQCQV